MRILTSVKRRHWGDSWVARDDDTHFYSDDPMGEGRTEAEAVTDLLEKLGYPKIVTEDQYFGWVATTEDYDGPGSPIGCGKTEQAAIDDLMQILEEKTCSLK